MLVKFYVNNLLEKHSVDVDLKAVADSWRKSIGSKSIIYALWVEETDTSLRVRTNTGILEWQQIVQKQP